jgi:beta-glucosidase
MVKVDQKKIKALIADMTLDEKSAQLGSYWMYELQSNGSLDETIVADKLSHGIGQITRVAGATTSGPLKAAQTGNQIQNFLVEQTRLGIPALLHEECCSGAMFLGGTMYPQPLGLSASFEPALAEKMTIAIRGQMLAIGARQGLAPVLDLGRDARWGRIEETFGEDATLASHFGVAYIRGLQGDDISTGVIATGKHFIGHSFSQGGLNCGPVHMGMREVYNLYIAPFQAAIRDAGLASIMNAYPELDGEVVAASSKILNDILRGELGFDGLIVSDYDAVIMIHNYHNLAPDKATAGRLALEAGIDVELPSLNCYGDPLKKALEAGDIKMETIDRSLERHLSMKMALGLFENPYVDESRVLDLFETPEDRALARELAQKSLVLLTNDGTLPLSKSIKKLAVIGPNADQGRSQLGDYSFAAKVELLMHQGPEGSAFIEFDPRELANEEVVVVTPLAAINEADSADTEVFYARGCDNLDPDKSGFAEAVQAAEQADAIVLFLGDRSGLVPACTSGETRDVADLKLPGVQQELAEAILATGKPVVVVLASGRPYAIGDLAEKANAILQAWIPGEEGGHAIADALFGDFNPGGKLPVTFPRSAGQLPITYDHKPSGMRSNWYVDYVDQPVTPLFAFGHGLSYTTFEYSELRIGTATAGAGETVDVSFRVRNNGSVAGDEVVQLYIRDVYASAPRPVKELKAYARLSLEAGQSKSVTFHLPVNQMAFYNNDLDLVVEPGEVQVMIGSSSADIRLESSFEISGKGPTKIKDRVFDCPVTIST